MSNEEKYRRALYLIDALCLTFSGKDESPEGKLNGEIYRIAHTAHGLCKSPACANFEELAADAEKALEAGGICCPWDKVPAEEK